MANEPRGPLPVIGAVAGIVSAVVAVLAYAESHRSDQQSAPPPTAPNPVSQEIPSPTSPAMVRWEGELLLVSEYADLDQIPPGRTWSRNGDLSLDGGMSSSIPVRPLFPRRIVDLPGDAPGTRDACAARLSTHGQAGGSLNIEVGTRFCVATDQGRIVMATTSAVDSSKGTATVRLTVWEK